MALRKARGLSIFKVALSILDKKGAVEKILDQCLMCL